MKVLYLFHKELECLGHYEWLQIIYIGIISHGLIHSVLRYINI